MSATPLTDGQHVWFFNQGGLMACRDMAGKAVWKRSFESVNDLGPAGQTWSLSSPGYSRGKIYHRGLRQIVCIGQSDP